MMTMKMTSRALVDAYRAFAADCAVDKMRSGSLTMMHRRIRWLEMRAEGYARGS